MGDLATQVPGDQGSGLEVAKPAEAGCPSPGRAGRSALPPGPPPHEADSWRSPQADFAGPQPAVSTVGGRTTRESEAQSPGRVQRWEYTLLLLLFLASMAEILVLPPTIHGDGVGYFAYLRSSVFDGDLDFTNEFQHFGQHTTLQMMDRGLTRTGLVYNVWSVGPALLWSPFYAAGHLVALVLQWLGWQGELNGYSEPYVYAVAVGSAVYAFAGLLLTYRLCRTRFSVGPALMALGTVWFATSLTAYMYFHPSLSHAVSFFLVSSFLTLWWTGRDSRRSPVQLAAMGAVVGLMAATRLQNLLYLLPVAVYEGAILVRRALEPHVLERPSDNLPLPNSHSSSPTPPSRFPIPHSPYPLATRYSLLAFFFSSCLRDGWRGFKQRMRRLALVGGAALLSFAPQMVAWWILYGRAITNPYSEYNAGLGFAWASPQLWEVLFSSKHGLVSWTPAVGLALAGLGLLAVRGDALARVLAAAFLIQLYLVSAWSNWWQGASFGGRMFIELTPAFALGLAAIAAVAHRVVSWFLIAMLILLLALWNMLFMLQYGSGALPLEDYVPWDLVIHNQFSYAPRLLFAMAAQHGPGSWLLALLPAGGLACWGFHRWRLKQVASALP